MSRLARWALLVVGGAALAVPPASLADIIRLKDGSTLEGEIKRTDDGWAVTTEDGRRRLVRFDRVASIEARPKGPKAGGDVADQRLASLRRAVDSLTDIRQILERYRTFITQYD